MSEGTIDIGWYRMYIRCQVIRFNTWMSMYYCQCFWNTKSLYTIYIYIYWCVNINIYICTLIHAHIYETVRALFRGFGRLSPLNSWHVSKTHGGNQKNQPFWFFKKCTIHGRRSMTRSCLVKLLSFTNWKIQTANSRLNPPKASWKYIVFLRCNTQETQKIVGFPMMRKRIWDLRRKSP